ncbi:UNVERIFIED_CONTAM: hypothetical protein HHA_255860 [Hammondia hammondi]|eukprot:XP_008888767.1 hypothetical protein HHA_255860 [Hammondia hammondi]
MISAVDTIKVEEAPAAEPSSGVEDATVEGAPVAEMISAVDTIKVEEVPAGETSSDVEGASVEREPVHTLLYTHKVQQYIEASETALAEDCTLLASNEAVLHDGNTADIEKEELRQETSDTQQVVQRLFQHA